MSADGDYDPGHILGKVKLDFLDAEEALRRAREQAVEARALLPSLHILELDEFEHAQAERLRRLLVASPSHIDEVA